MTTESSTLAEVLSQESVKGELYEKLPDNRLRCISCGHRCLIPEGRLGICKVRFNQEGVLMVPWGYVGALQCDPIEKKPFFHAMPGTDALSFGTLGCDFHCGYCQNWLTSQALRDPRAVSAPKSCTSEELVGLARRYGAIAQARAVSAPKSCTRHFGEHLHHVAKREMPELSESTAWRLGIRPHLWDAGVQ